MDLRKYQQDLIDSIETMLTKAKAEECRESIEYYKRILDFVNIDAKSHAGNFITLISKIANAEVNELRDEYCYLDILRRSDEKFMQQMFMQQMGGIPAGQVFVYSTPSEKNNKGVSLLYDIMNSEKFKAIISKPLSNDDFRNVQMNSIKPPKNKKWFHQFDRKRRF